MTTQIRTIVLLTLTGVLASCGGRASLVASRGRTSYLASRGHLPQPGEIRVGEFLSDYQEPSHDPAPHAVGMQIEGARAAWSGVRGAEPLYVAQVGIEARNSGIRPPLALMFVVDRSGSMAEADKMSFVREGLRRLVAQLQPTDLVGITAFDDRAVVILPVTPVAERQALLRAIDSLAPNGGTNLSDGLRVGYSALDSFAGQGMLRRVVLLTDAVANVGETDIHRIAQLAQRGDRRGVQLSAIGVGLDHRDAVLVEMANQGYGNHYFLDSPSRIRRVFETEVEGLLEDVAGQVCLTFMPARGVEVVTVDGLDVDRVDPDGSWHLDLGRLGAGQHSLALFTLRGVDPEDPAPIVGRFELEYVDLRAGERVRASNTTDGRGEPVHTVRSAAEGTVARNSAVAWMARDLQDVVRLAHSGRYDEAQRRLHRARAVITAVSEARPRDDQLLEDLRMLDGLARTLAAETNTAVPSVRARLRVSMSSADPLRGDSAR